jgi:two-component system nitrogen regulation response regulator GlnG
MEAGSKEIYQEAHQHLDRLLLPRVLGSTDGNKIQAARLLGITRKTLRLRLRALGLADLVSAEGDQDDAPHGPAEAGSGVIPEYPSRDSK